MTRLGFFLLLFATPQFALAEQARSVEPRAALNALKDQLIEKYAVDPGRFGAAWTLAEVVPDRDELTQTYCDASKYGMHVESIEPPVVLIIYRRRYDYQAKDCFGRANLRTREFKLSDDAALPGVGESIWKPDARLHEDRLRGFWWSKYRIYYFTGLSLTTVVALGWIVMRNNWFSMRAPKS